jgi:hypothetical protein
MEEMDHLAFQTGMRDCRIMYPDTLESELIEIEKDLEAYNTIKNMKNDAATEKTLDYYFTQRKENSSRQDTKMEQIKQQTTEKLRLLEEDMDRIINNLKQQHDAKLVRLQLELNAKMEVELTKLNLHHNNYDIVLQQKIENTKPGIIPTERILKLQIKEKDIKRKLVAKKNFIDNLKSSCKIESELTKVIPVVLNELVLAEPYVPKPWTPSLEALEKEAELTPLRRMAHMEDESNTIANEEVYNPKPKSPWSVPNKQVGSLPPPRRFKQDTFNFADKLEDDRLEARGKLP